MSISIWVRSLPLSCLLAAGCFGSSSTPPPAAQDGGGTDGAPETDAGPSSCGATGDGGECNGIAQVGSPVTGTCESTTQPQGAGGTIADGTYVLTARVGYGSGCTATTYTATMVIAGNCVERVDGQATSAVRRNHALATSGNVLTRTATCGSALPAATYTATPTQLVVFDEGGAVTTWTKQ
jgi:hypothetical protein